MVSYNPVWKQSIYTRVIDQDYDYKRNAIDKISTIVNASVSI